VLLSDRDIRTELDAGRVVLDPYDPEMIQPASIDVRLDRWFRLFDNHRYPVIDPAADQEGLTHLVDVGADEPFVLHPGEFVLGATYERITLPDDVAARLREQAARGDLDEILVVTYAHDPALRRRSYELLAQAWNA